MTRGEPRSLAPPAAAPSGGCPPQGDAIVIGGGLAGVAAALHMADQGPRVTLLEATRRLGGRATSHLDPDTGEEIDNCQHVTMGACTAYAALLSRLGMSDAIEWTDAQTWIEPGGRTSTIAPAALPPPLHYAPSFAAARFLSPLDKAAIAASLPAIAVARRAEWASRTFLEFLGHIAQPESTIRRFWSPVVVSACNLDVDRVSASPALMVFQNALLAGPHAARIGVPRVPLARLYSNVEATLNAAGGGIEFAQRVSLVEPIPTDGFDASDPRATVVRVTTGTGPDAATRIAQFVVLAVPPSRVLALLPPCLHHHVPALADVRHSPILGIHLRFDRPILSAPHAVLLDRPTQWLFRKDPAGTRVHAVLSAAPINLVNAPESDIVAQVVADIAACIPPAADARLLWSRVIKSRHATFAATPGFETGRPPPGPIHPGCPIALAGDYTQTGWPATMESAVRSGILAVDSLLASTHLSRARERRQRGSATLAEGA